MRFLLLFLTYFLFAFTLIYSQIPITAKESQPAFCDSIYIDSVNILSEKSFPDYLTFYFRNEGTILSGYPILACTFESNPYYGTNEKDISIISLFDRKGGFSNGRTVFHFQLAKSSPANTVPDDFVLKGIASLRMMNDQTQMYDTCTFAFDLKPGTKRVTSAAETGHNITPHIVVSPNPASNSVTVQHQSEQPFTADIDIINMYGIVCKRTACYGNRTIIDISNLPSGCYIVRAGEFRTPLVILW